MRRRPTAVGASLGTSLGLIHQKRSRVSRTRGSILNYALDMEDGVDRRKVTPRALVMPDYPFPQDEQERKELRQAEEQRHKPRSFDGIDDLEQLRKEMQEAGGRSSQLTVSPYSDLLNTDLDEIEQQHTNKVEREYESRVPATVFDLHDINHEIKDRPLDPEFDPRDEAAVRSERELLFRVMNAAESQGRRVTSWKDIQETEKKKDTEPDWRKGTQNVSQFDRTATRKQNVMTTLHMSGAEFAETKRNPVLGHEPHDPFQSETTALAILGPQKHLNADDFTVPEELARSEKLNKIEAAALQEERRLHPSDGGSPHDGQAFFRDFRRQIMYYNYNYRSGMAIQKTWVIILRVQDNNGKMLSIPFDERPPISIMDARKLAREHGKDLIQVGEGDGTYNGRTYKFAKCIIADRVAHAMEQAGIHFNSSGITQGTMAVLEVGIKGSTQEHALKFKSMFVARFLLSRRIVRLVVSKFGTPREGFPVMDTFLRKIKAQAERINASYVAGRVQFENDQIICMMYPSNHRISITGQHNPSDDTMRRNMERAIYQFKQEREVEVPNFLMATNATAYRRYEKMRSRGLAWTYRGGGMTLPAQRRIKEFGGYLRKGIQDLYDQRGDLDFPATKLSNQSMGAETSIDRLHWPRESNLEQHGRGAAVVKKRLDMPVSMMYDLGEVEKNTSVLQDSEIVFGGSTFDVHRAKVELGIKKHNKRRRVPARSSSGFSTMGIQDATGTAKESDSWKEAYQGTGGFY